MENENLEMQMDEQPGMSTKDMLIQALENAGAEDAPTTEEPAEDTPAEDTPADGQISMEDAPVEQSPRSKEDIINAFNNAVRPIKTEQQPAEEEPLPDFNSEEFMEQFYDNPAGAVEKAANVIAEKKIKEVVSGIEKRLQPLLDQSEAAQLRDEVKKTLGDFLNNTEDAKDYFDDMTHYIRQNNLDPRSSQSYLDAYRVSKLNRLGSENERLRASQGKGLNDFLSDENSLNEITQNETVRQRVIDEYLKGLNNGDKPRTISSNGTNQPSAQPVNKPTTMKDAKAMLLAQLQG